MKVSIIHPFYNHNFAIDVHIQNWRRWNEIYKNSTEIIIVDDGSPESIDIKKFKLLKSDFNIKIFRILEDIKWNVTGARNLGLVHAVGDWFFPLDFDMVVLNETFKGFYNEKLDKTQTYWPKLWFPTVKRPERMRGPHCNSFFIEKTAMKKSGFYDEDFAGRWGWEDTFMHNVILPGIGLKKQVMSSGYLRWYQRFACQHVTKNPKDFANENFKKMKNKEKLYRKNEYKNGPILRFKWEQVL